VVTALRTPSARARCSSATAPARSPRAGRGQGLGQHGAGGGLGRRHVRPVGQFFHHQRQRARRAETTIANNPDLVRRFVAGTREAFEAAKADPEASIAAGRTVSPDLDHDLWMAQLKVGLGLMPSPRDPQARMGVMNRQDWDDTAAIMKQYQELKTDKTGSAFFTAAFLPR
jgi:ABC-type nitrate/sulfonate/bicarbonate transport system substrate-binding protein